MEKPKCNFTKGTPPSQAVGNGLGKWLTPQQIDALKSCVATYKKITQAIKTEPSFVDEKRQLDRAGKLALELALILGDAGPDLDEVFHFQMGGFEQVAVLKKQLESLSDAIENKLFQMPTQSRATAHGQLVSMIANVLRGTDIKLSVSSGSKFFKICKLVFESGGIQVDPKGSIDAYLETIKR